MSPGSPLKIIVVILFTIIIAPVFGQIKTDAWHAGEIELIDNRVYQVDLRYVSARSESMLQARENGELLTLSPLKVKSFEFFDSSKNEYRYFISIPNFMENHQYQKKMFIEVLYNGNSISLLRYTDSFGMMATEGLYLMDQGTHAIFPYAVAKYSSKNRPVYINADIKLLFQLADDHKKALRDYAGTNQLGLRNPKDVITLLTYLDQISNISAQDNSPYR